MVGSGGNRQNCGGNVVVSIWKPSCGKYTGRSENKVIISKSVGPSAGA